MAGLLSHIAFCQSCKTTVVHYRACGATGATGITDQNCWGAKLLPMTILIYPVDYVYPCHLLRAQHHYLCPNCKENPPLACSTTPPHPTIPQPLPPTHPFIHDTHYITGVEKSISKASSKYCIAELAMRH